MTDLLIPVAAVIFAFLIGVLADLRQAHKFQWSKLVDHSTKAAMYLAAIGMLEVVAKQDPILAPQVIKFALAFAGAEVLGTIGMIRSAVVKPGQTDPLQAAQNASPFDILKK